MYLIPHVILYHKYTNLVRPATPATRNGNLRAVFFKKLEVYILRGYVTPYLVHRRLTMLRYYRSLVTMRYLGKERKKTSTRDDFVKFRTCEGIPQLHSIDIVPISEPFWVDIKFFLPRRKPAFFPSETKTPSVFTHFGDQPSRLGFTAYLEPRCARTRPDDGVLRRFHLE